MAIVMDSDQASDGVPVSETKQRIIDEFDGGAVADGLAWITDCRTIENYLPVALIKEAVSVRHPTKEIEAWDERWDNPFVGGSRIDKVAVAHHVQARLNRSDLQRWDLEHQVGRLVSFVRAANGVDSSA